MRLGAMHICMDWEQLRAFHAVARTGSLSAAAKVLKLTQPSVGRQIAALEAAVGQRLFLRGARGMTPTPAGESILADAERMEEAANGVERRLAGRADAARGRVRISATEGMGIHWLPRRLAPFRARNPGIELDIQVTNFAADLARREADIALRIGPQPSVRPGQGELITRRAGRFGLGLYASPSYLARRGTPRQADEVGEHDLIGFGGDVDRFPQFAWLQERLGGRPFSLVTNSLLGHVEAAAAGWGIAICTCFVAEGRSDLVRVLPRLALPTPDLWLVVHADLRSAAPIKAVYDELAALTRQYRSELSGQVA